MKNKLSTLLTKPWIGLLSLLFFQVIVALINLRNTVFQDEALYIYAGEEIVKSFLSGKPTVDHFGLFFSAYPEFYPPIAGVLNMLIGVEGVRLFSLFCILGATLCVYAVTKYLFNNQSAIFATILFAFQGSIMFIARLATFDALCLFLLSILLLLVIKARENKAIWIPLTIGPLLILATLAKYAALFFIPFLVMIFIYNTYKNVGVKKTIFRMCLLTFSALLLILLLYFRFDTDVIKGLVYTTTNRVAFIKTPLLSLLVRILSLGGIIYIISLLGVIKNRQNLILGILLFGASLLVPGYHLYKGEIVSLEKHIGFSILFIVPFAGYFLSRLANYQDIYIHGKYWLATIAICLFAISLGIKQGNGLYNEWPSTEKLMEVFRTQVRPGIETSPNSGHYLAEQFEVSRFYMQPYTDGWQWIGLDYFTFTNNFNQQLFGKDAYIAAVKSGYFDIIELDYGYNAPLAYAITSEINSSKNFKLIAKIPYTNSYGSGYFWVWRKNSNFKPNS